MTDDDDDTNSYSARAFAYPSIRPIEPWRASPSKKNTLSVRNSTSHSRSLCGGACGRGGGYDLVNHERRSLESSDRAPRLSQDVSSRGVPQRKGDNGKIHVGYIRYILCICRHHWRRDGRVVNGGTSRIFCLRSPRLDVRMHASIYLLMSQRFLSFCCSPACPPPLPPDPRKEKVGSRADPGQVSRPRSRNLREG